MINDEPDAPSAEPVESWRDREHPVLDVVVWFSGGLAGLSWLAFLALLGWYLATDWSAQVEGTLQLAVAVLAALALVTALGLTGLASLAAHARYRRTVWLVVTALTLVTACAVKIGWP
ncbi:hypothetical protein [Catellatospora sichuanensis]|uniref:hypothetical protein n=1 Tax=Catellatospora sichuanensis TaxID=1969805 RepID=UPI00118226A4|nr:hypothetical protein [Catellatospora sichuanensis]